MFRQEAEIQTLVAAGLTQRQARVFFALAKTGASTAKSLTRTLKFPRQDTYKVLSELQQLELVEKRISSPTKFSAIAIQYATTILLNRRQQEMTQLQKELGHLAASVQDSDAETQADESEPNLLLIPEGHAYVRSMCLASLPGP